MSPPSRSLSEPEQRSLVVSEARRWLRTPYHQCADVVGAGVDCGMLLVRVFVDSGMCDPFDPRPYSPTWHMHRDDEVYLRLVSDRCREIERAEAREGDVVLFRCGRCYSHGGVITRVDPLWMVHAFLPDRIVVEEEIFRNTMLSESHRRPRFFSLWGQS